VPEVTQCLAEDFKCYTSEVLDKVFMSFGSLLMLSSTLYSQHKTTMDDIYYRKIVTTCSNSIME